MTEPMFDAEPYRQPATGQACDRCGDRVVMSDDQLRVCGWVAFSGTSFTGKLLRVRICPKCRKGKA